ncbi:MAG: cation-transporting P-type ATPase [Proteobacteria bacterium]|nr:cation-transporting P-type ATPase [Pseudomonadota bacterium]
MQTAGAPVATPRPGRAAVGPCPTPPRPWHSVAAAALAAHWGVDPKHGLTDAGARAQRAIHGPNRLAEARPPSLGARLLGQLRDITVVALLFAALIAAITTWLGAEDTERGWARYSDTLAILTIVVLNALIGLLQEKRAERALAALRGFTSPRAQVRREGALRSVEATELVPGDVLVLGEGDRVPADARLLEGHDLEVREAALTGEALPVAKGPRPALDPATPLAERSNMLWLGTEVVQGRGSALVVATGMDTELGRIAGMLRTITSEPTPLQTYLARFGRWVVWACVAIAAVVFAVGLAAGRQTFAELLLTAVSLAVAAIPEGLPAITTIVLALGTLRMARRQALVRHLPAVEGLGAAQVICTDKTGTLTQNVMTVCRVAAAGRTYQVSAATHEGASAFHLLTEGDGGTPIAPREEPALWQLVEHAAHVREVTLVRSGGETVARSGNPTEVALARLALQAGMPALGPRTVLHDLTFTSTRKLATLVVAHGDRPRALVRGAPEVILARAQHTLGTDGGSTPLTAAERARLLAQTTAWGGEAMRVVALATREHAPAELAGWEDDLTVVGLVGMVDPPRPEAREAIACARQAGIVTVMITGDLPATARSVARQLDLTAPQSVDQEGVLLSGAELDALDDQALAARLDRLRIVARATPAHKLRVLEALQASGKVCAMTGDGINDAPAVKAAAIGVAMGRAGTEVTKAAADLVLADDNFATIVAAVEEGRAIFSNIKKFIFFLLSSNTGIVLTVFAAGLLGWAPPLSPTQILWINLITNGLPALALGLEPTEPGLMALPPRNPRAPVLDRNAYWQMLAIGALMAGVALLTFALLSGHPRTLHAPAHRLAQTGCFATLSLTALFHAFNCRSTTASNFQLGWLSNRALWGATLFSLALLALAIYVPALHPVFHTRALPWRDLGALTAISSAPLVLVELIKRAAWSKGHRRLTTAKR